VAPSRKEVATSGLTTAAMTCLLAGERGGTGLLVEPTTRVRQQRWTNTCSGVKGNLERVFVTNV
jgi:hypothetical protein